MWYPRLYSGTEKDSGKAGNPCKVYSLGNGVVPMLIF